MRLQTAAAYWSLLLGVGWLIPLMPFCTLLQSIHDTHGQPIVDHLYIQATLWDLDVSATCNTRIPMLRRAAEEVCVGSPLWGRHEYLEASRIACRLEDDLVHQYSYGCEKLAVLHVAGYAVGALWAAAAVLQMCATVNTFVFDQPLHCSRTRRRYMIAFYLLAPLAGWLGVSVFWSTCSLDSLILPSLVQPRTRTSAPAWGVVWVLGVGLGSVLAGAAILLAAEDAGPAKKPRRPSQDQYRDLAPGEVEYGRQDARAEARDESSDSEGRDLKFRTGGRKKAQSVRSV